MGILSIEVCYNKVRYIGIGYNGVLYTVLLVTFPGIQFHDSSEMEISAGFNVAIVSVLEHTAAYITQPFGGV